MSLYQFDAIGEKGKKITSTIDAESLLEAKQKLLRRYSAILQVDPLSEKERRVPLSKKELLSFTQELRRLLQAGLPLFEALSALEEKYQGQKSQRLLLDLCDRVRSGQAFSEAIAKHEETFDLLYISMVANAEKTGRLSEVLEEIAFLQERQIKTRKQIISSLLYPTLLAGFCFVILLVLLFFVVPSLKELFEGRDLHAFTRVVFEASAFVCRAKGIFFGSLFAFIGGSVFVFSSKTLRSSLIFFATRLPWISNLLIKLAFVRFCRATATLLQGGLPALKAFSNARSVVGHPLLEKVIQDAEGRIKQGEPIHVAFQDNPLIPPLVPRMIAIAQEGGKLGPMMQQIAEIYEDELETYLTRFVTLAQPILLLILGGLVGFVLLAVLLPLTDVGSFVT